MIHPSTLPLTLSANVLRLPYPPATRLVLAEIVSLHAANRGCCDCSDAHLAARLTIAKDTASVAVQLLEKDGLLVKHVTRGRTGFYRTLAPVAAAIAIRAATNSYPEFPGTRKKPVPGISPSAYPEIPATPTRNLPPALPGNSGSNTTLNTPENLQVSNVPAASAASGSIAIKKEILFSLEKEPTPSSTTTIPDPSFEEFWKAYAYKRDRKKSAQRWKALGPTERAAALAAVPAYVAATPDRHFRKNPLTWLNGACWDDEENPEPFRPRPLGPAGGPPPVTAPFAIAEKVRQQQINAYL